MQRTGAQQARASAGEAKQVCRALVVDPEERFEFDGYERLEADMRRDLAHIGWWFDTSALTPAETAERLVGQAADRAPLVGRSG